VVSFTIGSLSAISASLSSLACLIDSFSGSEARTMVSITSSTTTLDPFRLAAVPELDAFLFGRLTYEILAGSFCVR
jgi:hypothetical protein